MQPYLEKAVDLAREYANYFAPYEHIADPLIDCAEEGMTAAMILELFAQLKRQLQPIVDTISAQPAPCDDCLHSFFNEAAQLDFSLSVVKRFGYDTIAEGSTRLTILSAPNFP
jgi:carboxypeptidase Taq